jgi:hypothetical protein
MGPVQGETALGKVDLYGSRSALQTPPDVFCRFGYQVLRELLSRITGYSAFRVNQAERGGRNDGLLDRQSGLSLRRA